MVSDTKIRKFQEGGHKMPHSKKMGTGKYPCRCQPVMWNSCHGESRKPDCSGLMNKLIFMLTLKKVFYVDILKSFILEGLAKKKLYP